MVESANLYQQHAATLPDFWQRRTAQPRYEQRIHLFGQPIRVQSNDEAVQTAVALTPASYSTTDPLETPPYQMQLVVQSTPQPVPPVPDDLMQHITYSGDADWLMMQLGAWGHAYIDLARKRATAVLTPELAQRPDLVSQCLLHTVWLNFLIAAGYGMLHASCLVRDGRALLLLAAHNTGKSTTSLHLALAGWRLLTDSMVFVPPQRPLRLLGFPTGRLKLRRDVLSQFEPLRPLLTSEVVRHETKFSLDLRQVDGLAVQETAVLPQAIDLFLMARHNQPQTLLQLAGETAVWTAVMHNSLYYDQEAVWQQNLAQLAPLLAQTNAYHLTIGHDIDQLLSVLSHPALHV